MGVQELLVLGDSDLLFHQVQGDWEMRDLKLIPYRQCLQELCQWFVLVKFRHIPRIHNDIADALATVSSMIQHLDKAYIDPVHIQSRDQHAYYNAVDEELDGEPWFFDIKRYIQSRKYPTHATSDRKRTIRCLPSGCFLSGEILYKRTPDLGLLRCVKAKEALGIMVEIHSGVYGPHMNGYVLSKKILRAGYYWLTMERNSIRFVRKCHQCQVHSDLIHSPPAELHTMSTPWPFIAWGMDVIGPIKPKASNEHRFILVAIDYFTKWVEAVTFKSVTKKGVVDFVHANIIYRFGIPKMIITDNATNLNSHLMQEVCQWFKIVHQNSTQYRPKANGIVEAASRNIKKILQKMVQGSRQWNEKLPFALLGYRTTIRTSTGVTLYLLVYEKEAVIPKEIEIPSLRVIAEAEIDDDDWVKTRLEHLSLIDEKRLTSVEAKGKFSPNWQGPFIVKKVLPNRALYWTDIEGKMADISINADAVKRYYELHKPCDGRGVSIANFKGVNKIQEQDVPILEDKVKFETGSQICDKLQSGEIDLSTPPDDLLSRKKNGTENVEVIKYDLFPEILKEEAVGRLYELGKVSDANGYLERTFQSHASIRAGSLLRTWMEDAGLKTWVDQMGNVHGRAEGINPSEKALLIGSHLDTVIDAGFFDGSLGIICSISALKALNSSGRLGNLTRPVEVIAFSDEEGVRFQSTFLGSAAIAGILPVSTLQVHDKNGVTVQGALRASSIETTEENLLQLKYEPESVWGYVEVHIEQGPVLENVGLPLASVKGIAGQTRLKVTVKGTQGHAGTVPMNMRQDPMVAAAELIVFLESLCKQPDYYLSYDGQCTSSTVESLAGSLVTFTIDVRAMDDMGREAIIYEFSNRLYHMCDRRSVFCNVERKHDANAVVCDPGLSTQLKSASYAALKRITGEDPGDVPVLMSGAGHDAMAMSHLTKVGMLFVRCRGGISHSPAEHVSDDDVWAAGMAVLAFLETML
ncbi:Allantoate deiminase [Capsicum baccatum]|uniref:Allantoate deiminase n=1 Tax=Capsicum baccatum TaxID=33114 RepID=A0A2G2XCS8_CAPBA|nr:Allantoate deiminase [Capsicum baccatum]